MFTLPIRVSPPGIVRLQLSKMRDAWWRKKAKDLQQAADQHDMKYFYAGLKLVFGPDYSGSC
jgi:hypothetical protein